jgi:D-alanyl-D-alanine carboxypeptidase/D-alanyl-D-alanine-endopeptidase (penicillin-binding protein 4)
VAPPDSEGPGEATEVVRPGTGVVRPGTGVVRPGTGVATPGDAPAKARAVVPDAPEQPLEPIHVVLPVIEVMPAKQGFLDRLVAGKPKKSEAGIAEEEAAKAAEEARKVDEQNRRADAEARRAAEEIRAKAGEKARKAGAKAEEKAREADEKAAEDTRKADEKARRAEEKTRRAEAKARDKAARADDDDDYDDDDEYDEDEPLGQTRALAPPMAPPARPQQAPAQPMSRPAPPAPPRPTPQAPQAPHAPPAPPSRPQAPQRPMRPPQGRPQYQADPRQFDHRQGDPRQSDPRQTDPRQQRRPQYAGHDGPRRRPVRRWLLALAAAVVLGAGSAVVAGQTAPPAQVQWAAGLDTGAAAAVLDGLKTDAKRPTNAGLAGIVNPLLADAGLGGRVTASIVDVATGESLFELDGGEPAIPASTAKLLTAAAVLHSRGLTYQIPTRVVAGAGPGEVVLIGGGDPTLAAGGNPTYAGAARMDALADQVRKALGTVAPTHVYVDTSLYSGPSKHPSWDDLDLRAGLIAHPTALMTDGARTDPSNTSQNASRYWEPDVAAGEIFAELLGLPGDAASAGQAPPNAKQLGQVLSMPIGRMVELMLDQSDNVIAEALARQAALGRNQPASFDGAAQATRAVLAELGVRSDGLGLVDGSGLSNDDKVSAAQLTAVLGAAASPKFPELRPIVSGLPVAAYSGTLAGRYQGQNGGSGAGTVRAKTGTLTGVNSLAGIAVDRDGRLLAFSMVADAVSDPPRALQALDRVAAAIANCGC